MSTAARKNARQKAPATRSRKPKPHAVATQDECRAYALRLNLVEQKKLEHLAAATLLDAMGEELKAKYNLPSAYTFDVVTGHLNAVPVEAQA